MNTDGRIMNFLSRLGDMFLLNILYLISCIPVVTIGAATTAREYTPAGSSKIGRAHV